MIGDKEIKLCSKEIGIKKNAWGKGLFAQGWGKMILLSSCCFERGIGKIEFSVSYNSFMRLLFHCRFWLRVGA